MGRLKDFRDYLDDRIGAVGRIGKRLGEIQAKYESFYAEVSRVREDELRQLTAHIVADRAKLPGKIDKALDEADRAVAEELAQKLGALDAQVSAQARRADELQEQSIEAERKAHEANAALDTEEEELKARTATLLAEIDDYNRRIRELSRGWGFFANVLKMRPLANKRRRLVREHEDVAHYIDALRRRWVEEEGEQAAAQGELHEQWLAARTALGKLQTKRDHLEQTAARIRLRSTVERVLYALEPDLGAPAADHPRCPRCETPNPPSSHFCHICARRLGEDRPDLEGSLREIAELNLHHRRFGDGMKACQEILGLVQGLRSGLEAFVKSVKDMMNTESTCPLPKLAIDVPEPSVTFGAYFDELEGWVGDPARASLHPTAFAEGIRGNVMSTFSEANIKAYFETMGKELSRQAKKQWK